MACVAVSAVPCRLGIRITAIKCQQNSKLVYILPELNVDKIGFDTAENKPSKLPAEPREE